MNNKIVLENPLKSQEVNTLIDEKIFIVRVETNFQKLPVWSTKPKRGTIFKPSKTIYLQPETLADGNVIERKIKIVPTAEYGYPTVQTQEYWYALQYLWEQQGRPKDGKIEFSRREIISLLDQQYGKNTRKGLEQNISQLSTTYFEFDYVFYDKEKDITHSEIRKFHLISDEFFTRKKEKNEIIHDKCVITLHPFVVSNLLNNH